MAFKPLDKKSSAKYTNLDTFVLYFVNYNQKTNNCRYRTHCYKSYVTAFSPVQEEECSDNYKKSCYIEYGIDAVNQTVRMCR